MASTFVIDHKIPAPTRRAGLSAYPFGELSVGDSFFVPNGNITKIANCWGSYRRYHNKPDLKFTARTLDGGVRVWRVA